MANLVNEAAGLIVLKAGTENYFLSRSKRFVKHNNRNSIKGANRAYVHTVDDLKDLVNDGKLNAGEVVVFPAYYDKGLEYTVVTNTHPMLLSNFITTIN